MDWLSELVAWISEHETFLSGLAALVAVVGVLLTPVGLALRQKRSARPAPPAGGEPASPPARATPKGDRPSLAVLPFANLSEDRDQEFLADGMTEDLITGLAANRQISVVARNSTFAFKGRSPDIRDVGRELGVRYVLEGSVRRVGDRMRTTAQLIDAATGEHLWAERFDRPYVEVLQVQDELISAIAGALDAQLTAVEYERARRGKPSELGAWERMQRALLGSFQSMRREQIELSLKLLREAVAMDPGYACARAALAWLHYASIINGLCDDIPAAAAEARRNLAAALEGGADDPLILFYAGGAHIYAGRFEVGIQLLERSLARYPHQPNVHMHLGMGHCQLGRLDEAHRHFDRAEQLAPSSVMSSAYGWYRSFALGFEERWGEAVEVLEAALPAFPSYGALRVMMGLYLDALGRHEEAVASVARALRDNPGLVLEGVASSACAHPDPAKREQRLVRLRALWNEAAGQTA